MIFAALLFLNAMQSEPSAPTGVQTDDVFARAKQLIAEKPNSEGAAMAKCLLAGQPVEVNSGWFKPNAEKRHDWAWVAKYFGVSPTSEIQVADFEISKPITSVLDRNGNGRISAEDFDWSSKSKWVQDQAASHNLFNKMDSDGSGRLSESEWNRYFETAAGKKDLSHRAFFKTMFPSENPGKGKGKGNGKGQKKSQQAGKAVLLKGLLDGEIGSIEEGPKLAAMAPDFTLRTKAGKEHRLSDSRGKRPLVLVLGNFSCGPFRSNSGALEDIYSRFHNEADFLAIYVRDAHPTDGWRSKRNDDAGIAYTQPKTDAERIEVAGRCQSLLKFPMPLLVDGVDDRVGRMYSGMPDRLYVIDKAGLVAFKSPRGPFGFRVDEMAQALATVLLEQSPKPAVKSVAQGE